MAKEIKVNVSLNKNYSKLDTQLSEIQSHYSKNPLKVTLGVNKVETLSAIKTAMNELVAKGKLNLPKIKLETSIDASKLSSQIQQALKAIQISEGTVNATSATKSIEAAATETKKVAEVSNTASKAQKNLADSFEIAKHKIDDSTESGKRLVAVYDELIGKLKAGEIDTQQAKVLKTDAVVHYKNDMKEAKEETDKASESVTTLGDRIENTFNKRLQFAMVATAVALIGRGLRQVYQNVVDIDSALTQLQIVTNANTVAMKQYASEAAKVAQETGSSLSDTLSSVTTYARLGYNTEDSMQLSKVTGILSNTADVQMSEAQSYITSIKQAYGDEISSFSDMTDKLIDVGQKLPISAGELGTGMQNSAAGLKESGNTLDQAIAILTAANNTVQDASKSSNAVKTVAARIRSASATDYTQATEDLEDLGEAYDTADIATVKYQEDLMNYAGVSITENGELRSTYDILNDLAGKWGDLGSEARSVILGDIAGKQCA